MSKDKPVPQGQTETSAVATVLASLAPFRPKLLETLPGYTRTHFARDVGAGLTVGIVALPLAMAFAIASGLKPEAGLFTAVIAGFLISALGGSRVQIGGPAGAFIVIVYGILERHGLANLLIATVMSGLMLFLMGLFKLGTLVRFIPIAVVIGFTNGIAVLIMLSQLKDFLGLSLEHPPAGFFAQIEALRLTLHTVNPAALGIALGTLALVVVWQRGLPGLTSDGRATLKTRVLSSRVLFAASRLSVVPGTIVALILATLITWALNLPIETIGSKFGGIPATLPSLAWPAFSWDGVRFLLMPAFTLALLGAIESLLCARIADGVCAARPPEGAPTGAREGAGRSTSEDRHDPNQELMAQGVANIVTPFFGGMPATGTIARTVTNAKSGAVSPVAGMVHALTLLAVMLVAAPLASHVPLAALAGILMVVAWNMGEWREFAHLRQYRLPYRVTLLAVFTLTVVADLTVAVEVGLVAACLTFIYRISSLTRSETVPQARPGVLAWRLYGALFFGAVKLIEDIERQLGEAGTAATTTRVLVLDLKNLLYIDSSGADTLRDLQRSCARQGVHLVLCGLSHQPLDMARRAGLLAGLPEENIRPDLAAGLDRARALAGAD
ncbi:STAS domain-containing protein [Hylemonella gracilis]|uniref:STAS domain-containing protein n=1 Tax=Hylemonella gracilis TaxID=80880 RepID=A0A4P6UNB6_9BURK|nr:SulP family inorganic anion transporter [Hylemonella gracilis]QBK06256.1 STAS domain-containing protein [Hylemonella gracilis]